MLLKLIVFFLTFRVTIVSTAEEADVLYLIEHTFGANDLEEVRKGGKILNQFWWDGLLVTKESLAHSARIYKEMNQHMVAQNGFTLPWIPTSFDLSHEAHLAEFILTNVFYKSYAESVTLETDSAAHKSLIWIIKTFYGKQSIDYPITTSTSCAIRHLESKPRLASYYIQRPVLVKERKFDLRYYVFVKSLQVTNSDFYDIRNITFIQILITTNIFIAFDNCKTQAVR